MDDAERADLDALARARYISLTTFRADGSPVATPVWQARDGERILVITKSGSGKVRRLALDPRVTVAPCTARGKQTGASLPGMAVILDEPGTRGAAALVSHRYGLMGRLMQWRADRGSTDSAQVGIAVTLDPPLPAGPGA